MPPSLTYSAKPAATVPPSPAQGPAHHMRTLDRRKAGCFDPHGYPPCATLVLGQASAADTSVSDIRVSGLFGRISPASVTHVLHHLLKDER